MINKLIEKIKRKIAIKYFEERVKTFSLTKVIPAFELMELSPDESIKYQQHMVIDMVKELSESLVEKDIIEVEEEYDGFVFRRKLKIELTILSKKFK